MFISAADYARYAAFVEQQAKNETFVRLFNEHLTQFQDKSQVSHLKIYFGTCFFVS